MKINKKEEKILLKKLNESIDKSYKLGRKHILKILKNEIKEGIRDGYIGIKYSCLLDLINELEAGNGI